MSDPLLLAAAVLIGLCVGSFLNVVVYRLPLILQRQWRRESTELLGEEAPALAALPEKFNLAVPRSKCPRCGHGITALENIPVLSWLVLRGKCSACKSSISARYPIVEAITAILTVWVIARFGSEWPMIAAVLFVWALIALTLIDADTFYLPDNITLPLLWLGLFVNLWSAFADLESAVIGALAGYLSLWSIYWAFKLITGKEGMGYGDFKLLAAIGAWLGWQALPGVVIASSVAGIVYAVFAMLFAQFQREQPMPFGPYLAAAGFVVLMYGDLIKPFYLP